MRAWTTPLDEYGERYCYDDEEAEAWDSNVLVRIPEGLRAPFRIHVPLVCEGGVSSRRIRKALTDRGIRYAFRVSYSTGNRYVYVRSRAREARRALRSVGVFWA